MCTPLLRRVPTKSLRDRYRPAHLRERLRDDSRVFACGWKGDGSASERSDLARRDSDDGVATLPTKAVLEGLWA